MPISNSNTSSKLKRLSKSKSARLKNKEENKDNQFLTIAPALPVLSAVSVRQKLSRRSSNTLRDLSKNNYSSAGSTLQLENDQVGGCNVVTLQQTEEGKFVVASRSPLDREKNPDRICLDRRGLTIFPWIVDEPKLRLISLQHNLISKLEKEQLSHLTKLVFLDLYDNKIDRFCNFDSLENLRVLLMGKNRIKKIEGLQSLSKLEVLDLHGNQIMQVSGLEESSVLKVLNLAGNNIKNIGYNDFEGLVSLKELNLRRNKIKKLLGLDNTPELQKLYLNNNDIQRIEDMGSVEKALKLKEITIDGNPVNLNEECMSFLVSYLPNLQVISTMKINEQIRKAAMAWRILKEQSNSAFLDLSTQVCVNVRREEVISNAKSNWEILRTQAKALKNSAKNKVGGAKSDQLRSGSTHQLANAMDNRQVKNLLHRTRSKDFGGLISINEKVDVPKSARKKSGPIDNVLKSNDSNDTLEFKLPPILIPIIDNLTNHEIHKNIVDAIKTNSCLEGGGHSSGASSDVESSESHQSLKSALRYHLIKSNARSLPMDAEPSKPSLLLKNNIAYHDINSSLLDDQLEHKDTKRVHVLEDNEARECQWWKKVGGQSRPVLSFKGGNSLDGSNRSALEGSSSSNSTVSSTERNRARTAQPKKLGAYRANSGAGTARAKKHKSILTVGNPTRQPLPPRDREQGGDYLIEIMGSCLSVYGDGALRFIDKQWDSAKASGIDCVKFNYVHYSGIATVFNKLKSKFPNAEHFFFKETNISHLGQLNALAEAQGLNSIHIEPEGNPIASKNWKDYAAFRLAHWGLKAINGNEITEDNVARANKEYSGLVDIVAWSLPEFLLQPLLQRLQLERFQKQNGEQMSAKQFLFNSDPALRSVVAKEALQWRKGNITQEDLIWRHKGKIHLSRTIEQSIDAIRKLQVLEREWPDILNELILNTLIDYSDMCAYTKRFIQELENN